MKKLLTLLFAAGMVLSSVNGASAVDLKVSGAWLVGGNVTDGLFGGNGKDPALEPLRKDASDGNFTARQRIRINLDMSVNESISGRIQLQVGNGDTMPHALTWGESGVGGTGKAVTARLAYLDWLVPTTDVLVRMGRQGVVLPSYVFNSPVLDGTLDGVVVHAPINEMVSLNVGWLRPSANLNKWGTAHYAHSSVDLAFLSADFKSDGYKISPWGMIGLHGNGVKSVAEGKSTYVPSLNMMGYGYSASSATAGLDSRTTVYWAGLGGELTMFDPFRFTADFVYSGNDADGTAERKGWYAALGAEMKTSWATPFLRGWYASGDDADSKGSNRMLSPSGTFNASAIYFDALGMLAPTIDNCSPAGTWGLELGVKGVSLIDDLNHMLTVTYFQGTNNTNRITDASVSRPAEIDRTPIRYMTTADSAWEINFLSNYAIYKNLTASLLLAYMITDFDENIRTAQYDNAFRGALMFSYAF